MVVYLRRGNNRDVKGQIKYQQIDSTYYGADKPTIPAFSVH